MSPRVSVIIVSYRSRAVLAGCLDSLRVCGEGMPVEVTVIDNASGDDTVAFVREQHPGVDVVANPDNRGFTRGVNQGLERSRGEYLLVLNPDCVVTPEALVRLMRALDEEPELAAAAPMLLDGEGQPVRSCGRFPDLWTLFCDHLGLARAFPDSPAFGGYKYGGRALESLGIVGWASGAALLIPRRAYQKVGGLDERIFMYMEEVDWCLRAARAGLRVRYVPEAQIVHWGQQSSRQVPGETYLHNLRSRVYYFRKHHGPFAAAVAKAILLVSLALKWGASAVRHAQLARARVYARGLEVVWVA